MVLKGQNVDRQGPFEGHHSSKCILVNSRTFWGETFFDYPGHRRTAVYNSVMEISSFYHPFNQSKYNAALKIAKLFCHWLMYLYKDELSIVWRCAGKKPDGIDFMSFSCQLSCGALSLKCWKFEKSLVCNCIPLFLWSFGFEYQSLELHIKIRPKVFYSSSNFKKRHLLCPIRIFEESVLYCILGKFQLSSSHIVQTFLYINW